MKTQILLNKNALWIGAHYSKFNKRLCLNVIPFVTFAITRKGGNTPIPPEETFGII